MGGRKRVSISSGDKKETETIMEALEAVTLVRDQFFQSTNMPVYATHLMLIRLKQVVRMRIERIKKIGRRDMASPFEQWLDVLLQHIRLHEEMTITRFGRQAKGSYLDDECYVQIDAIKGLLQEFKNWSVSMEEEETGYVVEQNNKPSEEVEVGIGVPWPPPVAESVPQSPAADVNNNNIGVVEPLKNQVSYPVPTPESRKRRKEVIFRPGAKFDPYKLKKYPQFSHIFLHNERDLADSDSGEEEYLVPDVPRRQLLKPVNFMKKI